MKLWDIGTIWLCKIIYNVMRLRGSHGAALPGLIAEKLNPGLLKKLTSLPEGIIIVSGTNGKTTTTHLLAKTLKRMGKKVFTNHSGSNMTRGLLASIVRFSDLFGRLNYDIAVLEIDEAYAAKLAPILKPRASILTNVLRDQLDRFGEIDHTAQLLGVLADETLEFVVYNSADKRLAGVVNSAMKANTVSYSFKESLVDHFPDDDALYASAGRHLPKSADYTLLDANDSTLKASVGANIVTIDRSLLPGWHNTLNLLSVYALITEMYGAQEPALFSGLKPPYGRGEVLVVDDCTLTLQLVKNPSGFRTAMDVEPNQASLIIVNDLIADGRDVSWFWDVDVGQLAKRQSVSTSGTRAYDMAVRLKYADIAVDSVETDVEKSLKRFITSNKHGVIFLTYTAMLRTRKILKHMEKNS